MQNFRHLLLLGLTISLTASYSIGQDNSRIQPEVNQVQNYIPRYSSNVNWLVNLSIGIEAHDKRLFNYSERESLLEMQPEFWGTYHYGLDIQRKIIGKDRITILLGTGITFEKATFDRPFNHLHFKKDSFYILRHQNEYKKILAPVSMSFWYKLKGGIYLNSSIRNQLILRRTIGRTEYSEPTPYAEEIFEFEGISLKLGLIYTVNKFWIGLNSRIVNYQRIDKIIFNPLIRDPRSQNWEWRQNWEWNNPIRFDFTVGYLW